MKISNKKIHIFIIIVGIIFICIPVFHTNLWFDESYTVGLVNKGFGEIWNIGQNDVHPIFYYWILHIIYLIFGSNILIYRLFSVLCTAILGILGYTHIRKDFGEKTGLLFSLFVYFLPVNIVYAGEIRMYSLAMLLVSVMSIYAYRIYKNKEEKNNKNWIFFAIFSLLSAYTHYYGLMIAFLENLFLFICFIIQSKKEKKITYNLKAFIISALPQIGLYLPWLVSLIKKVSGPGGFWITINFPDTFIEFFMFPFTGNLAGNNYIVLPIAILFGIIVSTYMIYIHIKNRKNNDLKPAKMAIRYWGMLALTACITSLVIWRVVIYARYMLCAGGLFVFFIASTMSISEKKFFKTIIILISVILSVGVILTLSQENYAEENREFQKYLKESIKENEILICSTELTGLVTSTYLTENEIYFWDKDMWNVEEAYKAFGNTVYDLNFLQDYKGRIWITNQDIYKKIEELYNVKLIEQKEFDTRYKGQKYNLILIEK